MQIPQLTFTRFLASISIVILHYGLFTWPINSSLLAPFGEELISAMTFFFVLSGFILVISTAKNNQLAESINTRNFWRRRAARILPVYIFSVLVFFSINFRYDPSIPLNWQIQSYYHSLFLLQSWKYKMALDINYPAWSLSVEAFFYFIFPWLYANLKSLTNKKLLIVSGVAWVLNLYIHISLKHENVPESFIKYFPLLHVATFIIGVCFGILLIRNYKWLKEIGRKYIFTATIILSIFVIYTSYKNFHFYQFQHNGLLSPYFILILYSLSLMEGRFAKILASKPLIFLGSISYSIYIFQYPVLQICQKYLPWFKGQETKDIFYPYLILLLSFSSLSYLFLEKPARAYLTRNQRKKA